MHFRMPYRISTGKFVLLLIVACIPVLGQVALTVEILKGSHSRPGTFLWIAAVWLVPHLGALAYVLFGLPGVSFRMRLIAPLVLLAVAVAGFLLLAVLLFVLSH